MGIKRCFIPSCSNNVRNAPTKIFMTVPNKWERRKNWFEAAGLDVSKGPVVKKLYCCEDHFDLEEDAENWLFFKAFGKNLFLKKHVVPHKNLSRESESEHLHESARKRKRQNLCSETSIEEPVVKLRCALLTDINIEGIEESIKITTHNIKPQEECLENSTQYIKSEAKEQGEEGELISDHNIKSEVVEESIEITTHSLKSEEVDESIEITTHNIKPEEKCIESTTQDIKCGAKEQAAEEEFIPDHNIKSEVVEESIEITTHNVKPEEECIESTTQDIKCEAKEQAEEEEFIPDHNIKSEVVEESIEITTHNIKSEEECKESSTQYVKSEEEIIESTTQHIQSEDEDDEEEEEEETEQAEDIVITYVIQPAPVLYYVTSLPGEGPSDTETSNTACSQPVRKKFISRGVQVNLRNKFRSKGVGTRPMNMKSRGTSPMRDA